MNRIMYMQDEQFIIGSNVSSTIVSLHINLFFLRIMKEHCIFLEAGFTPKEKDLADQAEEMKKGFENLLIQAIELANGAVSPKAIQSRQFVTPFTARAERLTGYLTGIPADSNVTEREMALTPRKKTYQQPIDLDKKTFALNGNARRLTGGLADFKEKMLSDILNCRVFTVNYPLELLHMLNEANLYIKLLDQLESPENIMQLIILTNDQAFWNNSMAEHSKFIAGKLDPTENNLIEKALKFSQEFSRLSSTSKTAQHPAPAPDLRSRRLSAAKQFNDFQIEILTDIMDCKTQSIMTPLFFDHHIRETMHFIWLLEMGQNVHL